MSMEAGAIEREKAFGLADVPAWLWVGIGVYALLLLNGSALLNDSDTYWQIAVGQWILDHGALPRTDFYSFTKAGEPWTSSSWLAQVLYATSYRLAGWTGPVVLAAGSIAATFALLTHILGRRIPALYAVAVAMAALVLSMDHFLARPHVLALPIVIIWAHGLISASERGQAPSLWLLPWITLWANLHGGFLLGFFVIGVFGGVALLRRDWAGVRVFAFVGAACLVATLINPLGWRLYEGSAATLGHFVQAYITEWQSYYQNMEMPESIPGMVYVLLFVALELRFVKNACPLEARLLSWLFLLLGIYQFRYMSFFFLFSTVPLALHLDRLLARRLDNFKIQNALAAAGIMGVIALPVTCAQARPSFTLPHMISEQDARYLQTHLPKARLLNHWNAGGLLIFYTRGSVPLFVDGRAATAYPDGLLRDYFPLVAWEIDEAAWDAVIEKYKIDTVLWVKAHEQLRRFLVDKRGWKEEYAGNFESIYAKPRS